jgi:hypothetical protein
MSRGRLHSTLLDPPSAIRKRITVVPGLVTDVTFDDAIITISSTGFLGNLREDAT